MRIESALELQARIFARRKIETGFFLTLKHHAIGGDVEISGIRIARDNAIRRSCVTPTIERPVLRDRQLSQIHFVPGKCVPVKTCFRLGNFARRRAMF